MIKTPKKPKLTQKILINMLLSTVLSVALLSSLWIHSEYSRCQKDIQIVREKSLAFFKEMLKSELDKSVSYLEYKKIDVRSHLMNSVKGRVYEAHAIALNLFKQYHDKMTPAEIQEMIKEALRPIRFNEGRGYYFAFDMKGIETLFADRPDMEGKDMLPVQGARGEYVVRDMLDLVKKNGEGFYEYTWTKPNRESSFSKVAFVKSFEPFGWVIGTGEYIDDVEGDIQKEILQFIEQIRYGKEGNNVFAGKWNGVSLTGPAKGQNMWNVAGPDGRKIIQELIHLAKKGSGYVEYVAPEIEGGRPALKLAYIVGVPEWQWYVGASAYIDEIETAIAQRRATVGKEIINHIFKIVLVLAGIILLVLWAAFRFFRKIGENLDAFSFFLNRAAIELAEIDPGKMSFSELQDLSISANNMVKARKKAEDALRKSERRSRELFENSRDGFVFVDAEGCFIDANHAYCQMLGYTIDELKQKTDFYEITPPRWRDWERKEIWEKRLLQQGYSGVYEKEYIRKDGTIFPVEIQSHAAFDAVGRPSYLWGIVRNITERKRIEKELQAERDFNRTLINLSPFFFVAISRDGQTIMMNESMLQALGYSSAEVVGKAYLNTFVPERDHQRLAKVFERIILSREASVEIENAIVTKDRAELICQWRGIPVFDNDSYDFFFGVGMDITDRKRAEEEKIQLEGQLQKAQKMEAIGTLAGGIAHDFNNILFPIIGRCEIMLGDMEADSGPMRHVKSILDSARRASDLVRQILAFSRQSETGKMPVKIQKIIREVLSLIRHSIPSTIDIALSIDETCDVVLADASQIHQVIMNLIGNAYHAMEETGGRLEIGLNVIQLGPDNAPETALPPGRYVDLHVSDTGSGIDKKIIGRIFDPYFTTKESGKGTGLGLAVSYGIVKKHDGAIQVLSRLGEGSTFHVYLPVMETGFEEKASGPGAIVRGGTEQILFVDDEFDIVDTAVPMLERLGYRVTARTGSMDALEAFRNDPDRFDIVITDMTMPNMTGVQLAGEIHKIRPGFPIILITGFSMRIDENNAGQMGISALVMKPIVRDQLAVAIRRILDGDGD